MQCEWDSAKADSNAAKHGVTFQEAATALDDAGAVFIAQSYSGEYRLAVIGYSAQSRVLYVVCVEREGDVMRIISARKATRHEKRTHQEGR